MGKQSTRENKTFYQICCEETGLTRSDASEKMTAVSDSKIEKFEYEMQEPTPYDIIQMADAYKRPDQCYSSITFAQPGDDIFITLAKSFFFIIRKCYSVTFSFLNRLSFHFHICKRIDQCCFRIFMSKKFSK